MDNGGNLQERDITDAVKLSKGIQNFYHKYKQVFIENEYTVSIYKETENGREFIFNIP